MNILLTGANGFLGRCLYNSLVGVNSFATLGRNNTNFNLDLRNCIPFLDKSFDLVIHSAGKAHSIPKSAIDRQDFFDVNVSGTFNLLKGLENSSLPKQFIFISSVSVYGQFHGQFIREDFALSAIDPYGLSKIKAEKIIQDWCFKNKVVCTILRLPLIVGSNPPGNLGAMINGIKKGYYFNIANGQARKSMLLAVDVAKYIPTLAEVGGIYNLTDGYHPNFYELSHLIANQLDKKCIPNMPLSLAKLIAKTGDLIGSKFPINSEKLNKITSTLTFDDSKARAAFGWNPTPVLEGFKIN